MVDLNKIRVCPDCGDLLFWDEQKKVFQHKGAKLCYHVEMKDHTKLWDNKDQAEFWKKYGSEASPDYIIKRRKFHYIMNQKIK